MRSPYDCVGLGGLNSGGGACNLPALEVAEERLDASAPNARLDRAVHDQIHYLQLVRQVWWQLLGIDAPLLEDLAHSWDLVRATVAPHHQAPPGFLGNAAGCRRPQCPSAP
eukprot:4177360-Prymnesium_polylepis.1